MSKETTEQAGHSKRDAWSKVDVLIKAFGVVFISGAVTFYTIYSENKRADTQLKVTQQTNNFRLYAEAMSSRQATDTALKSDLISPLLSLFRGGQRDFDTNPINELTGKITALELLAHNFHEKFDLKRCLVS